ncbi:hypothetical protein Tco_0006658 [Tanacetum coccineum]
MVAESTVPQLVDKKGGSYAAIAPKLEPKKFNKWKKRMLCYLARMEPYYIKCIKDGLFQPEAPEGGIKPKSQWTQDERCVVVQDQCLKSIIMSCLPDDIIESVISCETTKATWTDLVYSFEGPSDTKENKIMYLKLKYRTFRTKPSESLLQTCTRYKTLLNEPANDGVNLFKHEINVGFMNSLPEKWLTFSQGLRNANYTQTIDLANIYESVWLLISVKRFSTQVFSKLIQSSQSSSSQADPKVQKDYKAGYKKMKAKLALLEANEKEVSVDEEVTQVKVLMALADDKLSVGKNHARNGEWIDITMRKVNILLSMDEDAIGKITLSTLTLILIVNECLKPTKASNDPESSKDSQSESLTPLPPLKNLQGASPSSEVNSTQKTRESNSQIQQTESSKSVDSLKMSQDSKPKVQNSGSSKFMIHVVEEKGRIHEDLKLKRRSKLKLLLYTHEKKINEKWLISSKKVSQCISEQIPHQKKKVLGGELLTESLSKIIPENVFISASMDYDHEIVPTSKYWVERLNPNSNLPNFNTGRILGASPSSEVMSLIFQPHSPKERSGLGIMKHTKPETQDSLNKSVLGTVTVSETEPTTPSVPTEVKNTKQESKINELTKLVQMLIDEKVNSTQKTQESNLQFQQTEPSKLVDSSKMSQDSKPKVQNSGSSKSLMPKPIQKPQLKTSDHEMYTASLKRSENYKAQPYQYASPSKQILKAKAKPFPPCTHYVFNDHKPTDCRNYRRVLAESFQSSESSIGVKCNTCGSTIHSTIDHNEFDHFKRETHQGAHLVPGQWTLKEYDWCQELSAQICRATRS